jgi:hypothetical protein
MNSARSLGIAAVGLRPASAMPRDRGLHHQPAEAPLIETETVSRSSRPPLQAHRHNYVRATVSVRQYPDASLAIFDGPRCLRRYDADGQPAAPAASDPVTQEAV